MDKLNKPRPFWTKIHKKPTVTFLHSERNDGRIDFTMTSVFSFLLNFEFVLIINIESGF